MRTLNRETALDTHRTSTAAATGLLALALLTGCTTGGDTSSQPDTGTTTAPAPIDGDRDGDGELSEHEKQVLATTAPRDITLLDGTVVTVTPGDPLPQPAIDQIIDKVAADAAPGAAMAQSDDGSESFAGMKSVREVAVLSADELGHTVIIVYREHHFYWASISSEDDEEGITGLRGTRDRGAMIAAATEWAESHDALLVVVD